MICDRKRVYQLRFHIGVVFGPALAVGLRTLSTSEDRGVMQSIAPAAVVCS